jgi:phosphohistidine swiveling domain-containing protein
MKEERPPMDIQITIPNVVINQFDAATMAQMVQDLAAGRADVAEMKKELEEVLDGQIMVLTAIRDQLRAATARLNAAIAGAPHLT